MRVGRRRPSAARRRARGRLRVTRDVLALGDQVLLRLADFGRDDHLALALGVLAEATRRRRSREMTACSFGLRASKSSATRGRPPVMSLVFVVSRGILAMTSPASIVVAVGDVDVRADRQEVARLAASSPGSFLVLPVLVLDRDARAACRRPCDSMMTLRERPVTSSSCSSIVTPSTMSPYFTTPPTSVRIGIANGSHSASSLAGSTCLPSLHQQLGAVDERVALALAARVVDDDELAVAVHDHEVAVLAFDRAAGSRTSPCPRCAVSSVDCSARPRAGATDVERTHRELRARLADRLRGDDADRFADVDHAAAREVAAVALRRRCRGGSGR